MLVHHGAGHIPFQDGSGIAHGEGEAHRFLRFHAIKEYGHGEGRYLAFGNFAGGEASDKILHFIAGERLAIALLADEFLRQHYFRSLKKRVSKVFMRSAALAPSRLVSSCEGEAPSMPAARFVMTDKAATRRPKRRARIVSGTVDMPTAVPPTRRNIFISAGVSKDGPE